VNRQPASPTDDPERELLAGLARIYAEDARRYAHQLSDRLEATDAALATRLACGDPAALTPLYQRHRGRSIVSRCSGPVRPPWRPT